MSTTAPAELHAEDKSRRYCEAGGHMLRLCPQDTADRYMTPVGRKMMMEEAHAESLKCDLDGTPECSTGNDETWSSPTC